MSKGDVIAIKQFFIKQKFSNKKTNSNLRYKLSKKEILDIIDTFPFNKYYDYIFENPLPKNIKDIKNTFFYDFSGDYEKEVFWYSLAIEKYKKEINLFLDLKNKYEESFLSGNYEESKKILDIIDKEICISIWSIENRLLLAEYKDGIEYNKKQLDNINKIDASPYVNHLAGFYSRRAEKGISVNRYNASVEEYVKLYEDKKNQNNKEYFKFKLLSHNLIAVDNPYFILAVERNSSIIDRYLTFKKLTTLTFNILTEGKCLNTYKHAVKNLSNSINDLYWKKQNKYLFSEQNTINEISNKFLICCENYTKGEYLKSYELSNELVNKNGSILESYDILIKSALRIGINEIQVSNNLAIKSIVIKNLTNLLQKNYSTNESISELNKIACSFCSFSLGQQIFNYLLRYFGDRHFSEKSILQYFLSDIDNIKYANIFKNNEQSVIYIDSFECEIGKSTTLLWKSLISSNIEMLKLTDIPIERINFYSSKIYYNEHNYVEAIKNLQSNYNDSEIKSYNFKYESVICLLYDSYIGNNELINAMELLVDAYIYNNNMIVKKDPDKLYNQLKFCENTEYKNNITYPILCDITNKGLQQKYEAYDSFMRGQSYRRPRNVIENKDEYTLSRLVTFLHRVCTQEVLYKSIHFDGTEDIENERINILQFLMSNNVGNLQIYNDEINEITKKNVIRKAVQEFDESKIHVNIDGVKKSLDQTLKEGFDRYLQLTNSNIADMILFEIKKIDETDNKLQKKQADMKTFVKFTKSYGFMQFRENFLEIRDKFISKKEFGLECYLSTRIRHGTLLGQLRKPFDSNNLTTLKSSTGEYLDNKYWNHNNNIVCNCNIGAIQKLLTSFTKNIDTINDDMKDKWIQISTEKNKNNGLFNYEYNDDYLQFQYMSRYNDIVNYDEFVEVVIQDLLSRTIANLEVIKQYIIDDLLVMYINNLNNLNDDMQKIIQKEYGYEIFDAIAACRTSVQQELSDVARWFNLTQTRTIKEFNLDLAIETSKQIIYNIKGRHIDVAIDTKKCNFLFRGKHFSAYVDIFNILLDNIVKHSMLEIEDIHVNISAVIEDNYFIIQVINNISGNYPVKSTKDKIENIGIELQKPVELEKLGREGGTGYFKLKKIIEYDLNSMKHKILIDIVDNKFFKVYISILLRGSTS